MSRILKDKPKKDFPVPEGIEFMKIDPKTGQVSLAKEGILECFREGTEPTQKDLSPLKNSTDFFKFDFNVPTKTK
jgi:penicillin-binding protein 1A